MDGVAIEACAQRFSAMDSIVRNLGGGDEWRDERNYDLAMLKLFNIGGAAITLVASLAASASGLRA